LQQGNGPAKGTSHRAFAPGKFVADFDEGTPLGLVPKDYLPVICRQAVEQPPQFGQCFGEDDRRWR
jgi:hypothetical protein